jgi:hypothetical protein
MRGSRRLLGLTVAAALGAAPAGAATVTVGTGQVYLNTGGGYRPVAARAVAGPGSTVFANTGSSGTIVYPDGCVVAVAPPTVIIIAAQSPCASGTAADPGTFAIGAGAVVGAGAGTAALIVSQRDHSASP